MISVGERINSPFTMLQNVGDKLNGDLRVAEPGIIQSFDADAQTVTVQVAIKERIVDQDGNVQVIPLPILLDVPIAIPSAGGISLTLPIAQGDECLVVFSDKCIDAWWAYGGVQDQAEIRRHDLSDAFAIIGIRSQPRNLSGYSTTSAQLRTDDGSQCIDISPTGIDLRGNIMKNGVPL